MGDEAGRTDIIEEVINSVTHGIGLVLSLAGLVVLVVLASLKGDGLRVACSSVFGLSLTLLYAASTLYHSLRSPRAKHIFKIIDHAAIYVLIAGTYTPFTLISLRGFWGWTLFALVWGLAVFGVFFKIFHVDKFQFVSTLIYLAMGWMCLVAIKPILSMLPSGGLMWLFAGGMFYTVGVVFFAWKRIPYNHAIWHLFVMAGSLCHYFAVLFYVLP